MAIKITSSLPRLFLLLILLISAGCSTLRVNTARLPAEFARSAAAAGIPADAIAIQIEEAGSGKTRLSHHAAQAMQPASLMKLVTTAAALDLLGPDYRWTTRAYTDGSRDGETLNGNLIIKGSGDPRLSQKDLWSMLHILRAQGIRHIHGDLLLDRSLFESTAEEAMQFDGKPERAYNAIPDALLLDAKSLIVRFVPDARNQSVQVRIEPYLAGLQVKPPKLSDGECGQWRDQLGLVFEPQGLRFEGTYALACGERQYPIHANSHTHTAYFDAALRQVWGELGGTLSGVTREALLPPQAVEIAATQSAPLSEVIRDINKYSNNVMARQLLLALAAERGAQPANKAFAARIVQEWLASKGIRVSALVIDNGSGLSRTERLAAADLARILQRIWHSPTMPEFVASLPLAGIDGTMRRRVQNLGVKATAHIKTGSLSNVAGIAGYVTARSGKRLVIVCLVNHENADKMKSAIDDLLQWAYENG